MNIINELEGIFKSIDSLKEEFLLKSKDIQSKLEEWMPDMDYRTLRRYVRDHPDANDFLERQTQDALDQSHSKLIGATPAAAQRLIDVINDENNRGYVVVQAVESLFRIIDRGITDRENAEQLREIKESLNVFEGGKVFDV